MKDNIGPISTLEDVYDMTVESKRLTAAHHFDHVGGGQYNHLSPSSLTAVTCRNGVNLQYTILGETTIQIQQHSSSANALSQMRKHSIVHTIIIKPTPPQPPSS